jgi:hypothetical protein
MSENGFLKRWSRRKRAEPAAEPTAVEAPPSDLPPQVGEGSLASPPPAQQGKGGTAVAPPAPATPAKPDDEAIDPATLPPLESLGPESDYTVFMRKGVPEAIRTAALRKAWMSDPFIRDFRGPAEYALDYTTSEFDLRPTDDVAKMLDRIFPPKVSEPETAPQAPAEPAPQVEAKADPPPQALRLPQKEAPPPPQPSPETAPAEAVLARRKHGGALPD